LEIETRPTSKSRYCQRVVEKMRFSLWRLKH